MTRKFFLLVIFIFIGVLATSNFVFAWEVTWPEIPGTQFVVGNRCPAAGCPPTDLPGFIAYLFTFALVSAGIVALGSLIWGAIQFVASAGFPSLRSEARSRMTGAVTGLLLLLSVYVILNTINPELIMPGLGLGLQPANPAPTVNSTLPKLDKGFEICDNDICCNSATCGGGTCYTYNYPIEDLAEGPSRDMNDKGKAFKINDGGTIVNFWQDKNFKGEVASIEGPVGCTLFSDVAPPDLTDRVSSADFMATPDGITLCKSLGPSSEDGQCAYFSLHTGEDPQTQQFQQGNTPNEIKLDSSAIYKINENQYAVKDDEARWAQIPGGMYGILCINPYNLAGNNELCHFILETTPLKYYGDNCNLPLPGVNLGCNPAPVLPGDCAPFIPATASHLIVKGSEDVYCKGVSNCKPCKGVIFYGETYYNRNYSWLLELPEAVGFPIGFGNISNGLGLIDLTPGLKRFTKIDDIGVNFCEINMFEAAPNPYDISSLKLIGNCKLKVTDQVGNSQTFTKSIKDLGTVPRPGGDWNDQIKSFVLCNAADNTDMECLGW